MNIRPILLTSTLLAGLACLPAQAQSAPDKMDMGPGLVQDNRGGPGTTPEARPPRDCSKSRNPAACNERRAERMKIEEACQAMRGAQRQQCRHEQFLKIDCDKQANPQQCAARQEAARACAGQSGAPLRQCMQQKMPARDCRQSPNPARCEQHQKARAACQDKPGPEHKACLREQFTAK